MSTCIMLSPAAINCHRDGMAAVANPGISRQECRQARRRRPRARRPVATARIIDEFARKEGMATTGGRLRLGMIGGGRGSQIGDRHRLAAGALDIDPARGRDFALELGIPPERAYADWRAMVEGELARPDPVDLVTIATPNSTHHPIAKAFLEAGIAVLCEKPL